MITESGRSVADLGEWGLIAALAARMPQGPYSRLGIGDDSAVVSAPSGSVVAAVDLLLEGRHFLRSWSSAYDIGVKAAARSLADIAAMGAVPTALLVAIAAPGSLPARWALDLAAGLAAEASRAGAGVVGGDTAGADSVLISVTALGDLAGRQPVRRAGARVGDVVAVAGPLGHSAAGHALLTAGVESFPALVAAHRRPAPPYDAGPAAASLGATAMIDVSDGLLADLGHLAAASRAWIDIETPALAPGDTLLSAAAAVLSSPASPASPASSADSPGSASAASAASAAATGRPSSPAALARDWVLTGGEDHSLVATFAPSVSLPARWRVIGRVRESGEAPERDSVEVLERESVEVLERESVEVLERGSGDAATGDAATGDAATGEAATGSPPGPGQTAVPAGADVTPAGRVTVDGALHEGPGGWQHFR